MQRRHIILKLIDVLTLGLHRRVHILMRKRLAPPLLLKLYDPMPFVECLVIVHYGGQLVIAIKGLTGRSSWKVAAVPAADVVLVVVFFLLNPVL